MEAVEGGVQQMWMTGDGLQWHLCFVEQGVGLGTANGSRRVSLPLSKARALQGEA